MENDIKNKDLISIIIPVYNQPLELKKALDSILSQSYKNIEIIVVDDGSLIPLTSDLSPLTYKLIRQENKGAPAARNRGFKESNGEYVIFWDADVVAKPDMLKKMYTKLKQLHGVSYAYSDYYFGWKKMPAQKFDPKVLIENNFIMSTSLIRRFDFPESGWDESLKRFQDWDLWLTMFENKKIGVYIPEYLFKVIPHKYGMSTWLPSFVYIAPWKHIPLVNKKVNLFTSLKNVVKQKHNL